MCRGFHQSMERDRLKIKAFYLRLLSVSNATKPPLPDSLTLHYPPRINGSPLDIDHSDIRTDSPAFVTLHRVVSPEGGGASSSSMIIFASRERVKASEGVRFEVYMRDDKVLKGVFRKDEDGMWKLECKCVLETELVGIEVNGAAEVCVEVEEDGQMVEMMSEKVEMVVRRKRSYSNKCFTGSLEEIPEERDEGESESDEDCCYCSSCCDDEEIILETEGSEGGDNWEMDGVRWAVDVGIWVMCLGVGLLVSKASSNTLRRSTRLL